MPSCCQFSVEVVMSAWQCRFFCFLFLFSCVLQATARSQPAHTFFYQPVVPECAETLFGQCVPLAGAE